MMSHEALITRRGLKTRDTDFNNPPVFTGYGPRDMSQQWAGFSAERLVMTRP